jgi:rubrerythrin
LSDRIKELQELIEIVLIAIPREIEAYNYYMNAYNRAVSETSRRMFLYLAEQEKMHEAKLKTQLAELKAELELEKLKAGE